MANEAFVWGRAGRKLTPDQVAQEREAAALLAQGAMDYSPVAHWSQGLNRVAQGLLAGIDYRMADKAEEEIGTVNKDLIASLLSGGSSAPASAPVASSAIPMTSAAGEVSATAPVASSGPQAYRDAIASIESAGSGDYSAIGPTNPKLGRALGRYQIMEANIGPWSQAALGRAVTPEEFLASPEIQDAIFDKQFGQYVEQFGPEGAAQAWFAGPGGVGKTGRKDVLGTTVGEYGQRFVNSLGPTEVAAATPGAAIEAVAPLEAPVDVPAAPAVAEAVSAPPVQVAQASGINPAIIEALTNPQATPQTQRIAAMLLQQEQEKQQMAEEQRLQAADPLRQLQLQKGQLELEQMRNPGVDGVAVGNRIVDRRTGKVVYEAPEDPKAPDLVELFDENSGLPYKAKWNPETRQFERVGGNKAPSGTALTVSPDGQVSFTQGGAKPPTENQSKLTLFQTLQTETQPVLLDLEKQWDPTNLQDAAARSTPIAGNFFKSEQGQIYDSAATAWAEGALRIATGAAATPEEMERTKRAYFAQPGDTPNTISFKAQMREMYNRAINAAMGKPGTEAKLPNPSTFAKKFDEELETPPEGIDAEDWKFMTPEERKLFQ